MEYQTKQTHSASKETSSHKQKNNESKVAKKKNRTGKSKPISANELLNTQPSQPTPQQPVQQQQIPQPQGQFVFNAPAGFVPVVPVMAYNYNFNNAPIQGQQQFFAMPFAAHQPPVPGAPIPQMQPAQGYPQYMPMQYTPTQNAQPVAPTTKPFSANKGGYGKKYLDKPSSKGKDYKDNQQKGDFGTMIYQKYKTTLCRHFEETQTCSLGHLCSFAHGKHELRNINDPMPRDFAGKKSQIGALHSNYKTQICKNWEETGLCKFSNLCCFAHGKEQLRNMIDPVPQRVPDSLLFPTHLSRGIHTKSARGGSYEPEDKDYQGQYNSPDYDQNGDYQESNYHQQDYGDMQPQDSQAYDNSWNAPSYEQQPQFFTTNLPSAPVWQPSHQQPMPSPPQAVNPEHQEMKADDQVMV